MDVSIRLFVARTWDDHGRCFAFGVAKTAGDQCIGLGGHSSVAEGGIGLMLAGGPRRFILVLCHQFSRRQTTGSFFGGTVQWVGHGDSAAAGRWRGPIHHLVVGFVDAGWFPLVDVVWGGPLQQLFYLLEHGIIFLNHLVIEQ